jgi:hypothetical protein
MSAPKRIVFSNECPNDQGSIIPNDVFDFSRYKLNPVILRSHDWHAFSIGMMTDIKLENGQWSGVPVFHKITEESKIAAEMYEKGFLRSASVGGESKWKREPITGDYWKDENGLMRSEYFDVYEISLPTLPSNPMAVTEEAYAEAEKLNLSVVYESDEIHSNIVTLNSKLEKNNLETNSNSQVKLETMAEETVEKKKPAAEKPAKAAEKSQTEETAQQMEADVDHSNHVVLGAGEDMPGFIKKIISKKGLLAALFGGHPEGKYGDDPIVEQPKKDIATQPTPTGMAAEKSKKKAEEAVKKVKEAKEKYEEAEGEEEKEKFKKLYDEAKKEAEEACHEAEEAEEAAKKEAEEKAEEEAKSKKEAKAEEEAKHAAKFQSQMSTKPIKKTKEELEALNLAAEPGKTQVHFGERTTFSALSREDNKEGQRILNRVLNGSHEGKTIADYAIILNAVLNDPKYAAIIEKARFHTHANESAMAGSRNALRNAGKPNPFIGMNFKEIASRLNAGVAEGYNFKAASAVERRTTLSTDGSFSSLDTVAVEWLPMIIYKLFPSESWKNEIPIFGVQETARNLGIIWTNIVADPTISRGTAPSNASDYTYDDTAVGLKLVPYYLPTMRWTPLHMHQLRYDQQASGWSQALAKLEAQVGDDLIYTLAAGLIANSQPIIYTGGPIDSTQAKTFKTAAAGGNSVDKFYWNTAYSGELTKPGFNDIMSIEQNFDFLNFDLEKERLVLVVDPIAKSYIKQDKATQSMLTRWINDNGSEVQKISNSLFHPRSRVVAYDSAGGTAIDMNATGVVVPATTQSAMLAFVASQVGIGLGLIDVFFIQDPANYGFKMSMDMRIGTRALRSDYKGLALYAYGPVAQPGA